MRGDFNNNFRSFKATIIESQSSFKRVKRCIEVSPSVCRPISKSSKDSKKSSRCSLSFDSSDSGKEVRNSSGFQNFLCCFNHFCSSAFLLKLLLCKTDQDMFLKIKVIKFKLISEQVATTFTSISYRYSRISFGKSG